MKCASNTLKSELIDLTSYTEQQIREKDLDTLIKKMMYHIGSPDSELRDTLIYSTFGKLIQEDYLNHQQMKYIIETCLNEQHLFLNIGVTNKDSVFTRSFSVLTIALILAKDRENHFLSKDIVISAIESSINYLVREEDIRGYIEIKGWAHSIAHGADLLAAAIKHPLFPSQLTKKCLYTIGVCLFKSGSYIDDEDERLIDALEALLDKGTEESIIEKWMLTLESDLTNKLNQEGETLSFFRTKTNIHHFLKALYFRLLFRNSGRNSRNMIEALLERWHNGALHKES